MDPTYELICGELSKVMQQTHVGPLKMNRYNNEAWGQRFAQLCSEEAEISAGITTLIKAILHENCLISCEFTTLIFLNPPHNNSSLHDKKLQRKGYTFKVLMVLLSAREVQRIGEQCALRRLPSDLIRLVAQH